MDVFVAFNTILDAGVAYGCSRNPSEAIICQTRATASSPGKELQYIIGSLEHLTPSVCKRQLLQLTASCKRRKSSSLQSSGQFWAVQAFSMSCEPTRIQNSNMRAGDSGLVCDVAAGAVATLFWFAVV